MSGQAAVDPLPGARVALVHDWLTGMRGGEKCLEVLAELLPRAEIFTLLHVPGSVSPAIEARPIHTSFLQRLPGARRRYRQFLPLYPLALAGLRPRGYDLVVSISHCAAKGIRPEPGCRHLCYCLTPMRYAWDLYEDYFSRGRLAWWARLLLPAIIGRLRDWDRRTAGRVDRFVAISRHVASRIARHYGRTAEVLYPPVDAARFTPGTGAGGYYLVVSALAPYKRVDLALAACAALSRPLKVVGCGQDEARLRAQAGPGIEFLGWQPDHALPALYAGARALLFPGEEDFGIVPLEAQAAGRPVIAYGKGGARETVAGLGESPAPTGVFFARQTAADLAGAILRYEAEAACFSPVAARRRAEEFARPLFRERLAALLREELAARGPRP